MIVPPLQKENKVKGKIAPTIQTKLTIGSSNDKYEREADSMSNQIMRMPQSFSKQPLNKGAKDIQRKCANCEKEEEHIQRKPLMMKSDGGTPVATQALGAQLNSTKGSGSPLPSGTNSFMSNAFGSDFSHVRVHTDSKAQQMNQGLNARAFTHGSDVYFNRGEYNPGSFEGKRLLGHELTHVVQQNRREQITLIIQRRVELRPPGPGEASGFGRVNELIDRLNNLLPQPRPMTYRLDGQILAYDLHNEAGLTNFDRQMRAFIDNRGITVPMRLITSQGLSTRPGNPPGTPLEPVDVDDFDLGYVDIEDLLASDDLSLQLNVVHILEERFQTRNYARRIGTVISDATFNRAHRAGLNAEATLLQNLFNDPTIRFTGQYDVGSRTLFQFTSQAEGYRIFHEFRFALRVAGGTVFVIARPGSRRQTVAAFLALRNARRLRVPAAP